MQAATTKLLADTNLAIFAYSTTKTGAADATPGLFNLINMPIRPENISYPILMIDPPWLKRKGGIRATRPNQTRALDYKTMPTADIFNLLDTKIFTLTEPTHAVFLWTIDQYLIESDYYMRERGYKRHCRFIWDKLNGVAPSFTVRYTHEYLIWYYKPAMLPIAQEMRGKYPTVFSEKARQHSRKPDYAYTMINKLYPTLPKLDVFSREHRNGWDQFGDQTNYF